MGKKIFRIFLFGPAGLAVFSEIDYFRPISDLIRRVVLNYEEIYKSIWRKLEILLGLDFPISSYLFSILLLFSFPLLWRVILENFRENISENENIFGKYEEIIVSATTVFVIQSFSVFASVVIGFIQLIEIINIYGSRIISRILDRIYAEYTKRAEKIIKWSESISDRLEDLKSEILVLNESVNYKNYTPSLLHKNNKKFSQKNKGGYPLDTSKSLSYL